MKVLAARQFELARRLDRIEQEMEQAAGRAARRATRWRPTPWPTPWTSRGGWPSARRCGPPAASSRRTASARPAASSKQIAENLQEVLDILANRREPELARLVKKISARPRPTWQRCGGSRGVAKADGSGGRTPQRGSAEGGTRESGRQARRPAAGGGAARAAAGAVDGR